MPQTYTFESDNQYLINPAPGQASPDGLTLLFTITGTNSGVLKINTAPPGAAVSLTSIPYLNGSLALQSAGTAVTASGLAYILPEYTANDLYLDLNWTSGSTVVLVSPRASGGSGGGSGGETPAADVTPGTFGANIGSTGDYAFPDDVVVGDDADVVGDLTAGTIASDGALSGTGITGTSLTINGAAANPAATVVTTGAVNTSLRYDASNKLDVSVSSAGAVTYNATGASAGHSFSEGVTVAAGGVTVTGTSSITGVANAVAATVAGGGVTGANTTRTANITETWNTSGVVDGALRVAITDTASGANSLAVNILGGASATTALLTVDKDGDAVVGGTLQNNGTTASISQSGTTSTTAFGTGTGSGATGAVVRGAAGQTRSVVWRTGAAASGDRWAATANATSEAGANAGSDLNLNAYDDSGVLIDTPLTIVRAAAGALYTPASRPVSFGGAPGAALTTAYVRGSASAIADNVATTIATITVPNAVATATIRLTAQGALGAGGAIGAGEAMASNSWNIVLARTAGVNVVAQISAAYGADAANVAGAATCTAVVTLGAVAGAVGATNTVPVQITIVKSGGASDNHTATWEAVVLNASATGVTIA